ncbi:hypothetical protein ASG41_13090 [Modestobacter sp. Leaf380]|nr:hypothetical protein ASG41_13090 [Modestobacter sp. Leaf380]
MPHDRYGDLIEDERVRTADPLPHDPRCVAGWLPDTPDGLAVPCLTCRPHLANRSHNLTYQLEGNPR